MRELTYATRTWQLVLVDRDGMTMDSVPLGRLEAEALARVLTARAETWEDWRRAGRIPDVQYRNIKREATATWLAVRDAAGETRATLSLTPTLLAPAPAGTWLTGPFAEVAA